MLYGRDIASFPALSVLGNAYRDVRILESLWVSWLHEFGMPVC